MLRSSKPTAGHPKRFHGTKMVRMQPFMEKTHSEEVQIVHAEKIKIKAVRLTNLG